MIDFLEKWVLNIAALAIFIVLLELLIPSGKVRKFVNLISGFILIIAMINPFLGLVRNGVDLKELQVSDGNYIDRKIIEKDSKVLEEAQMKQIIEIYRGKIIWQLEDNTNGMEGIAEVNADIIMDEDYTAASFGEIKRVYLKLIPAKDQKTIQPVSRVEKIKVGAKDKPEEQKHEKGNAPDKKIQAALEAKVNKLLGVPKDDIVITLQDGGL